MHIIHKQTFILHKNTILEIPNHSEILTIQQQGPITRIPEVSIWYKCVKNLVSNTKPTEILVVGTGWEKDLTGWDYITTLQFCGGELVYHFFQRAKLSRAN